MIKTLATSLILGCVMFRPADARPLNTAELIDHIAGTVGLTREQAASAVDAVFGKISDALANGEDVRLVGFGTFSVTPRKARVGRNPQTGEEIRIPESKQLRFKAGKTLEDAVDRGAVDRGKDTVTE
jgi:DNA-binding protein HU-beta